MRMEWCDNYLVYPKSRSVSYNDKQGTQVVVQLRALTIARIYATSPVRELGSD